MADRREVKDPVKEALPVLALAALQGGDKAAAESPLNQLLGELAQDILAERRKKKSQVEALAKNAAASAKEEKRFKDQEKRRCSHRNQKNETRLSGQILSNGQLCLVCKYCHKEFFDPPNEDLGQVAAPHALWPPQDEIGDASGGRIYQAVGAK